MRTGRIPAGTKRPTAVFVSVHTWGTRQRAGFHHLAAAAHEDGWRVVFATVCLSPLSWIRRDERVKLLSRRDLGRVVWLSPSLGTYAWLTLWHPFNARSPTANR